MLLCANQIQKRPECQLTNFWWYMDWFICIVLLMPLGRHSDPTCILILRHHGSCEATWLTRRLLGKHRVRAKNSRYFWGQLYSEKAMATHSSTLAWKIPWTEEPGRLQSTESRRVGYDWVTSLSLFTSMHWRRKWQPTPVFLPGESQGWGSLVGCRLWGRTELDMTDVT